MKKLHFMLTLFALLALLAACGGDETPETKQSAESKAITEEVGGPFSAAEFKKFLDTLPAIPGLTAQGQGAVTGAALTAQVKAAAEAQGWTEERFTYIYSHAVSVLSLEQVDKTMQQMQSQLDSMPDDQKQMMQQMMGGELDKQRDSIKAEVDKQVPQSEQTIIYENIDQLRTALGLPAPQ